MHKIYLCQAVMHFCVQQSAESFKLFQRYFNRFGFRGTPCMYMRYMRNIKAVADEQVFYDEFSVCDKFYLLVCTRSFDIFFYDKRTCSKAS